MDELAKQEIREVCNLLLNANHLSVDDIVDSFKTIGFSTPSFDELCGKWDGSSHSIFGFKPEPAASMFWIHFFPPEWTRPEWEELFGPPIEAVEVVIRYNENYEINLKVIFDPGSDKSLGRFRMFFAKVQNSELAISINECICDENLKYLHKFIFKHIDFVRYNKMFDGKAPIEYLASLK